MCTRHSQITSFYTKSSSSAHAKQNSVPNPDIPPFKPVNPTTKGVHLSKSMMHIAFPLHFRKIVLLLPTLTMMHLGTMLYK